MVTKQRAARRSTAEIRRLIVAAAGKLFAERGYTQTTMRDVASEAGIGLSVLYRQFESKERLFSGTFVAPFLASFEEFRPGRDAASNGDATDEEAIGEFIRDLHGNLVQNRRTVITLLGALENPGTELIEDVREALGEAWRSLHLARGGDDSELTDDQALDANMLVIAMVVGLVVFRPWVAAARNGDDEPLVELAGAFSAAGMRAVTRA